MADGYGLMAFDPTPKRAADSATEMVQVVLPNDANPLGFILGGTVMHLIGVEQVLAQLPHAHREAALKRLDLLARASERHMRAQKHKP